VRGGRRTEPAPEEDLVNHGELECFSMFKGVFAQRIAAAIESSGVRARCHRY